MILKTCNMTTKQVLTELQSLGSESIKKILIKHGSKEPLYGVKVEDLKKVQKKIKENQQQIAMELYDSGIADAMYLAGLMADGSKMTIKELKAWANQAQSAQTSEYTVPWVASEHPKGSELAMEWIESPKESIATIGWNTLASIVATQPDTALDIKALQSLLDRIPKTIHQAPNRVRYTMNGFVIAVGSFVAALTEKAIETGKKIGTVTVDMNGTACKVPSAPEYIKKVKDKGSIGKKKKTAKC